MAAPAASCCFRRPWSDGLFKIIVLTSSGVTVLNSKRSREDRCLASGKACSCYLNVVNFRKSLYLVGCNLPHRSKIFIKFIGYFLWSFWETGFSESLLGRHPPITFHIDVELPLYSSI